MQLVELNKEMKRPTFCINDHMDILIEILKRLDSRSIATAACVCRLWLSITRSDCLWEQLCFNHVSPPPLGVKPVVEALGGYRTLYTTCLRPVLNRLSRRKRLRLEAEVVRRHEVELSISLFCIDYYERLGGGRVGDESASSLMFLCKPVNV